MKKECRNFEEAMQHDMDGCIPDNERAAFEDHLEECTSCREERNTYTLLLAGLENMPLEEPDADFNAAVLGRIPFPAREAVAAGRDWFSMKILVGLTCIITAFSSLGVYLMMADAGLISRAVANGFQRAFGTMEWLGMDSLRGSIDLARLVYELPILSTLLNLGEILLDVASTTLTDPMIAVFISGMLIVGFLSTLMMAKLMKPKMSGASSNGADITHIMKLF